MFKQGAVVEYTTEKFKEIVESKPDLFNTGNILDVSADQSKLIFKVIYNRCNVTNCTAPVAKVYIKCNLVPYCSARHALSDSHRHRVWCSDSMSGLHDRRHVIQSHIPPPIPAASNPSS